MAAKAGTAYVNIKPDLSAFDRDLSRNLTRKLTSVGKLAGVGLAAGIGGAAIVIKETAQAASDLEEQVNKTNVVFRGSEKSILKWSKNTATGIGISRREALEATGVFGNMLVPMGIARKRAGEMSTSMVDLAGDMASFNNASPEETLDALRAGLAGETEPLRRFGVFLNQARIEQEAVNLGLSDGTGQLDAAAKAQATYSLILKDTKDAQGDFGRTSETLANQQRILKAQFENVEATIGRIFLPTLTKLAGIASTEVLPKIQDLSTELEKIAGRKDLDLSEKLTLSKAAVSRKLDPLVAVLKEKAGEVDLGAKLAKGVEAGIPIIANSAAKAAPRAASAFVRGFREAGPWGKLITAAFLTSKLGGFNAAGSFAARKFTDAMKDKLSLKSVFKRASTVGAAAGADAAAETLVHRTGTGLDRRSSRMAAGMGVFFRGVGVAAAIAASGEIGEALVNGVIEKITGKKNFDAPGSKGPSDPSNFGGAFNPLDLLKQRGGVITGGKSSGDSVPALLERHEGVLNRNAVKGLGGPGFVDWANRKWPRFQKGGNVTRIPDSVFGAVNNIASSRGVNKTAAAIAWAANKLFGVGIGVGKFGHNKYTASGNISDHWYGNAIDLPSVGAKNINAAKWIMANFPEKQVIYDGNDSAGTGYHGDHVHVAIGHSAAVMRKAMLLGLGADPDGAGSGAGGSSGPSAAQRRKKRQTAARARVLKYLEGVRGAISGDAKAASTLGRAAGELGGMEDRQEFGIGIAERINARSEEDLDTPAGRTARIKELHGIGQRQAELNKIRRKRASKIKQAIRRKRAQIKTLRGTLKKAPQGAKASIRTRMRNLQKEIEALKKALLELGDKIAENEQDYADTMDEIHDIQTAPYPTTTEDSPASPVDSGRSDILQGLLNEANQRTAVSEAQFRVLRHLPPGAVSNPVSVHEGGRAAAPVIVHVVVEDGAVDPGKIHTIATGAAETVTRRAGRAGSRMLPGRPGVLA